MIQTQQRQHRRVQVMDVNAVVNGAEAQLVGGADCLAAVNAAAGQPGRKAVGVVVASLVALHHWRAAKFAGPQHQRALQHSALFQIGQQGRDRLVGLVGVGSVVAGAVAVPVPIVRVQLDEAHPALDHPPGQQAHPAKAGGRLPVGAVHFQR